MIVPLCQCGKPCEKQTGSQRFSKKTGVQQYYSMCSRCRKEKYAKNRGQTYSEFRRAQLKSAAAKKGLSAAEYVRNGKLALAKKRGLSEAQLNNTYHKYRKYKKDYCENNDGHLGFECTVPKDMFLIEGKSVLQVDHLDGNPKNNNESNLKTYCPTCHRIKTYRNNDHITPGRKILGIKNEQTL